MIRVLVIDDSAFNRDGIAAQFEQQPGVVVVGQAADGNEGLREAMRLKPDVITLDLEMPRMDGYTFLRILMTKQPTPVIVVSSHSARDRVFKALELGAVDFVAKPARAIAPELATIGTELLDKVLAVGRLVPVKLRMAGDSRDAIALPRAATMNEPVAPRGVVCIASSTGGPPALKELFEKLPADLPVGVLVSQHMPATFTGPFARRLDNAGGMHVKEASGRVVLEAGVALVAPGSGSLVLSRSASGDLVAQVEVPESAGRTGSARAPVPNADRMMVTAAATLGPRVMAIVLTGMGNDGSSGVVAVRRAGGTTVAESESSAVIFGMPEEAIRTGAVQKVVPLGEIARAIVRFARGLAENS